MQCYEVQLHPSLCNPILIKWEKLVGLLLCMSYRGQKPKRCFVLLDMPAWPCLGWIWDTGATGSGLRDFCASGMGSHAHPPQGAGGGSVPGRERSW